MWWNILIILIQRKFIFSGYLLLFSNYFLLIINLLIKMLIPFISISWSIYDKYKFITLLKIYSIHFLISIKIFIPSYILLFQSIFERTNCKRNTWIKLTEKNISFLKQLIYIYIYIYINRDKKLKTAVSLEFHATRTNNRFTAYF